MTEYAWSESASALTESGALAGSGLPELMLEMDFGDGWEIRTDDLRRFSTHRGRDRETDDPNAGTAVLVLDNRDGAYDLDLHPEVGPGTRVRLSVIVPTGSSAFTTGLSATGGDDATGGGDALLYIFTGRSEGGQETAVQVADEYLTWNLVDDFKRLNADTRNWSFSEVLPGARIEEVLDSATPAWVAEERDIDPGVFTLDNPTIEEAGGNRLSYITTVARSDDGRFFIAGDGKATFRDSAYVSALDEIPFGDVDGEQRYRAVITEPDDRGIVNVLTVSSTDALVDQVVEDSESQARYGYRSRTVDTMISSEAEMLILAEDLLPRSSQPQRRVVALEIGTRDTDWHSVLSKDIGDRVVVRRRPVYGGTKEQESVIEGIAIDSPSKFDWTLTWSLSKLAVGTPNLLTANQSSIEDDATGWTAEANCSLARVTEKRLTGGASLAIDVTATTATLRTTPVSTAPVTVGTDYTARAWMYARFSYALVRAEISWRDGGGSELSVSTGGEVLIVYYQPWHPLEVTGTAPASATHAVVRIKITGIGGPDRFYLDAVTLREEL